jgi:endo-1,4-beta-xylanase
MAEGYSRRNFLRTAGTATGAGLLLGPSALHAGSAAMSAAGLDPASTPLRNLAEAKGLLFGCAVIGSDLGDRQFTDTAGQQYDLVVPIGALKMDALRPTPDTFNFVPGDQLLAFAQKRNMQYRGHTLVWFNALPSWFSGYATPQNTKQIMLGHIGTVVKHYAGHMQSWDVINEALLISDGRADGLRNSAWLQMIGPEFIEMAFGAAKDADPNAMLCWNEYGVEKEAPEDEAKRQLWLRHLRDLRARRVPIHAIGIQSHLDATSPHFSGPQFDDFLHQVSDMGLKIIISELDMTDALPNAGVEQRNQLVASKYQQYLDMVLKHHSVVAVLTWGISDKHTWLNSGFKGARKDGQPFLPLPFDANFNAKPQWYAIARSFQNADPR